MEAYIKGQSHIKLFDILKDKLFNIIFHFQQASPTTTVQKSIILKLSYTDQFYSSYINKGYPLIIYFSILKQLMALTTPHIIFKLNSICFCYLIFFFSKLWLPMSSQNLIFSFFDIIVTDKTTLPLRVLKKN